MEATECSGIEIFGVRNLLEVLRILEEVDDPSDLLVWNTDLYRERSSAPARPQAASGIMDFSDIIGQESAKRGAEIAVSGGHNLIMLGPPGSGKSSLAKALVGILPPMTKEDFPFW